MRYILPVLSLAALAACQPPVPNDAVGGVGFGDYATYQQQREAHRGRGTLLEKRLARSVGPFSGLTCRTIWFP